MTVLRRSLVFGTTVALGLGLTACTPGAPEVPEPTGPIVQLGAPGEPNRTMSPEEAASLEQAGHTEADIEYMQMMILHHEQALTMTGYVEDRTRDRDIRLLAERMQISQDGEMDQMAAWLQERGTPLRDEHGGHGGGHDMPGMLTDEQLAELEAAKGAEFDRLFLQYMIQHHQGAMEMTADLWAAGGGQEASIGEFARHVESDQGIEITRMQQMLADRTS